MRPGSRPPRTCLLLRGGGGSWVLWVEHWKELAEKTLIEKAALEEEMWRTIEKLQTATQNLVK